MNPDLSVAEPPDVPGRLLAELLFGDELGVRLDSKEQPTCFILENYRGSEVARLPLKGGS